jgi:hypothetical protein
MNGATIFYDVECFICNGNVCSISCMNEIYKPGQKNLSETSVTVSNLTAGATYMFKVYVRYHLNGKVSEGRWRYVETGRVPVISGKLKYFYYYNISILGCCSRFFFCCFYYFAQ